MQLDISDAPFLLDALYRAGFGTYATALLASDDVTPGAHTFAAALTGSDVTISPEAWNTDEKPDMALCAPRGSSYAALIARNMFGIRPTRPGFHKFEIRPQIGDLPYAAIRIPTVKGNIGVSIGQNVEAYEAEVIVPPNTKATVYLPVLPGGGNTLFINNQISNFPIEKDCYRIELGSGTHRLLAQ
jgi:alpha-L-rhamnosidase